MILKIKCAGINRPHPQSSALVKCSSVSDNGHSIREGTTTARQSNEDLNAVTATLPWYRRALASLTMYGELSVAHVPEEFAPLRTRFQQEWSFAIGFVSRFTIVLPDSTNPLLDVKLVALSAYVFSHSLQME